MPTAAAQHSIYGQNTCGSTIPLALEFQVQKQETSVILAAASKSTRPQYKPLFEPKSFNVNQIGRSWCQTIGN